MAPHMPHGAPFALLAPQIDVWSSPSPPHPPMCICCHLCLIGTPINVWFPPSYPHPIQCAHFDTSDKRSGQKVPVSSSLPSPHIFSFFNTHDYVGQPKGILVSHSQGEFVMISVAMTSSISISSTNWLTWSHLGFGISNLQSSLPFCMCQHVPRYLCHHFV